MEEAEARRLKYEAEVADLRARQAKMAALEANLQAREEAYKELMLEVSKTDVGAALLDRDKERRAKEDAQQLVTKLQEKQSKILTTLRGMGDESKRLRQSLAELRKIAQSELGGAAAAVVAMRQPLQDSANQMSAHIERQLEGLRKAHEHTISLLAAYDPEAAAAATAESERLTTALAAEAEAAAVASAAVRREMRMMDPSALGAPPRDAGGGGSGVMPGLSASDPSYAGGEQGVPGGEPVRLGPRLAAVSVPDGSEATESVVGFNSVPGSPSADGAPAGGVFGSSKEGEGQGSTLRRQGTMRRQPSGRSCCSMTQSAFAPEGSTTDGSATDTKSPTRSRGSSSVKTCRAEGDVITDAGCGSGGAVAPSPSERQLEALRKAHEHTISLLAAYDPEAAAAATAQSQFIMAVVTTEAEASPPSAAPSAAPCTAPPSELNASKSRRRKGKGKGKDVGKKVKAKGGVCSEDGEFEEEDSADGTEGEEMEDEAEGEKGEEERMEEEAEEEGSSEEDLPTGPQPVRRSVAPFGNFGKGGKSSPIKSGQVMSSQEGGKPGLGKGGKRRSVKDMMNKGKMTMVAADSLSGGEVAKAMRERESELMKQVCAHARLPTTARHSAVHPMQHLRCRPPAAHTSSPCTRVRAHCPLRAHVRARTHNHGTLLLPLTPGLMPRLLPRLLPRLMPAHARLVCPQRKALHELETELYRAERRAEKAEAALTAETRRATQLGDDLLAAQAEVMRVTAAMHCLGLETEEVELVAAEAQGEVHRLTAPKRDASCTARVITASTRSGDDKPPVPHATHVLVLAAELREADGQIDKYEGALAVSRVMMEEAKEAADAADMRRTMAEAETAQSEIHRADAERGKNEAEHRYTSFLVGEGSRLLKADMLESHVSARLDKALADTIQPSSNIAATAAYLSRSGPFRIAVNDLPQAEADAALPTAIDPQELFLRSFIANYIQRAGTLGGAVETDTIQQALQYASREVGPHPPKARQKRWEPADSLPAELQETVIATRDRSPRAMPPHALPHVWRADGSATAMLPSLRPPVYTALDPADKRAGSSPQAGGANLATHRNSSTLIVPRAFRGAADPIGSFAYACGAADPTGGVIADSAGILGWAAPVPHSSQSQRERARWAERSQSPTPLGMPPGQLPPPHADRVPRVASRPRVVEPSGAAAAFPFTEQRTSSAMLSPRTQQTRTVLANMMAPRLDSPRQMLMPLPPYMVPRKPASAR